MDKRTSGQTVSLLDHYEPENGIHHVGHLYYEVWDCFLAVCVISGLIRPAIIHCELDRH